MKGTGVVGGMAYAPLLIIKEEEYKIEERPVGDASREAERFETARLAAFRELKSLIETSAIKGYNESAEIFDYQLLMLEDEDFIGQIKGKILEKAVGAEYALDAAGKSVCRQLSELDNDYLKARTADVADLVKRLQTLLSDSKPFDVSIIDKPCIIAAKELSPSQTAGFRPELVKGIVTEGGSAGSHSVIIARSLGIPCVIGVAGLLGRAAEGSPAILDAETGELDLCPDDEQVKKFSVWESNNANERSSLCKYIGRETVTKDGHKIGVYANIASEAEADLAIRNGAEGIGLFRTEFLFMISGPPSLETQVKTYSSIAEKLGGRPFVIRTLDIGGDKAAPWLGIGRENNPFLGLRAIRLCLRETQLFKTQVAAILASAVNPGLEMMLPMISTISELRQAKELIEETRREYEAEKKTAAPRVKIGMMVETPAAAYAAERFAKEADFFSIGTNDLTQYFFAADRTNERVSYLNSYFHPELLRLIKHICESGRKYGKTVDICGYAGEIPLLVPLFVAMGIDNLSVSVPSILKVRRMISQLKSDSLSGVLDKALTLDDACEVEEYLSEEFKDIISF